jgi:hypothetical protein
MLEKSMMGPQGGDDEDPGAPNIQRKKNIDDIPPGPVGGLVSIRYLKGVL